MAQQPATASEQAPVKVNMLHVCTPPAEETAAALAKIPKQPVFDADSEVSRSRSTLSEMPAMAEAGQAGYKAGERSIASHVRTRREFSVQRSCNPSVALAGCQGTAMDPAPNQSVYEPLFPSASEVLTDCRGLLDVKKVVSQESTKVSAESKSAVPPGSKLRRPITPRGEG